MNITFLIGNGFDLNLGLKTSYSDFLQVYKEIKPTDSEVIKKFKQDILQDEELWSNAEEQFGKYTEEFYYSNFTAEQYCECHEDFCANLAEYLKNEEEKIDFDSIPKHILFNFTDSFYRNIKNNIKNNIKDFRQMINGGIEVDLDWFKYNFINLNYTKTLEKLINLTFSNQYVLSLSSVKNNVHAHGSCDSTMVLGVNDETQIGNIHLFDGQPPEYLAQIMKPLAYQITDEDNYQEIINIIGNSDLIYIYGMSLGKTDLRWWKEITEHMLSNEFVHMIIHIHDNVDDKINGYIQAEKQAKNFFKTKQKIKDREDREKREKDREKDREKITEFLTLCNISNQVHKDSLMDRIHITRENIFKDIKDLSKHYSRNKEEAKAM